MKELSAHAIILAGGRGTRFWPRSRARTPKQLLSIVGRRTMLEQTVARLRPVFSASRLWMVTNAEQARSVRRLAPGISAARVLAEPVGRNTAAAIGLAAVHLRHALGGADAVMAVLPADHFIADQSSYLRIVRGALDIAAREESLVVLGIPPSRPETGYGYIECGAPAAPARGCEVFHVARFTEKPSAETAKEYLAAGRYFWNAGMFFWRVSVFLERLKEFLPQTHGALEKLAATIGTRRYAAALNRIYPGLESISVDYAIMEPAARPANNGTTCGVFVLPADVGWSDIGSWAAVYELLAQAPGENVSAGPLFALEARGNYFWSPKKFVAAFGVNDLVLVETRDALLLCPRDRAQEVGKVVQWLEARKRKELL
jgi:mannose-1-phosphate guanylyltransferase